MFQVKCLDFTFCHIFMKTRILSIATTFECSYIGHDVALNQVTRLELTCERALKSEEEDGRQLSYC